MLTFHPCSETSKIVWQPKAAKVLCSDDLRVVFVGPTLDKLSSLFTSMSSLYLEFLRLERLQLRISS